MRLRSALLGEGLQFSRGHLEGDIWIKEGGSDLWGYLDGKLSGKRNEHKILGAGVCQAVLDLCFPR